MRLSAMRSIAREERCESKEQRD